MLVGGGLFRRHVRWCAESYTLGGELVSTCGFAHGLGDTEVGHQCVMLGEQHVVRLDVAVDHTVLVGIGQGVNDITQDADGLRNRQFTFVSQLFSQRLPFLVGHDVVQEPVSMARIVERKNVGMVQIRCDLDLLVEPLGAQCRCQLGT